MMAAPINTQATDYYVPVTLGATALANGACRAILATAGGTVNLTQPDGTVRADFPLQTGYNAVRATVINTPSSGTAATGVWALY